MEDARLKEIYQNKDKGANISKKVAGAGVFIALAMIFSYVEAMIPIHLGIWGVKLGIANLVVVAGLYLLPLSWVWLISLIRIFLIGLLFGNGLTMLYSFAGGILSLMVMSILKKIKGFSITGVSIAGGVSHNVGQLLMAVVILGNVNFAYYLPVLLIAGLITGALIGLASERILRAAKKITPYI